MPDRIIRESICNSDTLDKLTWFEEVFWHRLTVNCDDFGRFDARPAIIKGRLFPLKDDLALADVSKALNKLSAVGLVALYMYDGKPYLQLVTWGKYQRTRAKKSKYPDPPRTLDDNCCQMTANVPENREARSENREANILPGAEAAPDPIVAELLLNDKTTYAVNEGQVAKWASLYPAVDVMAELRKMVGWCDANPKKRKTRQGIQRFINSWLSKEQDKGVAGYGGGYKNGDKNEQGQIFYNGKWVTV